MMPAAVPTQADQPVSDDQLTALALAADPDAVLGPDAVSIWARADDEPQLLPAWYMPRPLRRASTRRQRVVIGVVIAAFLVINAAGLCSTYGTVAFG